MALWIEAAWESAARRPGSVVEVPPASGRSSRSVLEAAMKAVGKLKSAWNRTSW